MVFFKAHKASVNFRRISALQPFKCIKAIKAKSTLVFLVQNACLMILNLFLLLIVKLKANHAIQFQRN